MKRKSRINENIGPAGASLQRSCCPGTFQRADRSRADGNDAPSFSFRLINRGSCFRCNAVKFTVHFMIFNIFFFYRAECPQSYVQGYKDFLYAFIPNLLQQFFRKMKTCCRSCRRASFPRVYGLVFVGICHFFMDIRRQRHFTDFIDNIIKHAVIMEFDNTAAKIGTVLYVCRKPFRKFYCRPRQCFFARLDQYFPRIFAYRREQQNFYLTACGNPFAVQAGRDDAGIVKNEYIAFVQFVCQIIKIFVLHFAALAVIEHEPRVVAGFCRMLCYEFFR